MYPEKKTVIQSRKDTSGWRPVSPILLRTLLDVKIVFTSFVLLCVI